MHIELTEMLRCPEPHEEGVLVLSTGEMLGRMVRFGLVGCPGCRKEYPIVKGVVRFAPRASEAAKPRSRVSAGESGQTLQALLDLSGPGGFVVLVGSAAEHAVSLAALMGGIHFVGVNAPPGVEELPVLSLLEARDVIPLRRAMARGVVLGPQHAAPSWIAEARRVLLRGRRLVIEDDRAVAPEGITRLAAGHGLFVGEKT